MSAPRTRKRLIDMLRRTAGLGADSRSELEDAELWTAHGRAARAMVDVERHAERLVATGARQRAQLEAAVEGTRSLAGRTDATSSAVRRLREVLERIDVVALNAALEGARANEPVGRGLILVAEEVRAQIVRGLDTARELETVVSQATAAVTEVGERLERTQRDGIEASSDGAQLKAAAQEAQAGFSDFESRLKKATGLDPETARLLAIAGDQARGLATSLSALEAAQGSDAFRALGPLLTPLAKLLAALPEGDATRSGERDG